MRTIAACAPARVSFAGGGTDLPAYADRFGGAVVSCTIDRYAGVRITPRVDGLELAALDTRSRELIPSASAARRLRAPILAEEHLLFPKAAAALFRLERGRIEVTSTVPMGVGLASSGSLAVALSSAIRGYVGESTDPGVVAEDAFRMEHDLLARPIGRQDQYASAFGGMNLIEMDRSGVRVTPLKVDVERVASRVVLLSNGARRNAAIPLAAQRERTLDDPSTVEHLHAMAHSAHSMRSYLEAGDLDKAGELLDQGWRRKRELSDRVSTTTIDHAYESARNAGAIGAKLCGAGSAGTLLVWCAEGARDGVVETMKTLGWHEMPFRFVGRGVRADVIGAAEETGG